MTSEYSQQTLASTPNKPQNKDMSRADTLYPQDPNQLKTVEEVARATGRTAKSILEYVRQGVLPAVDHREPGQRGRPRKMVRAGDIHLIAFRQRWENRNPKIKTPSGYELTPSTIPDNEADQPTDN